MVQCCQGVAGVEAAALLVAVLQAVLGDLHPDGVNGARVVIIVFSSDLDPVPIDWAFAVPVLLRIDAGPVFGSGVFKTSPTHKACEGFPVLKLEFFNDQAKNELTRSGVKALNAFMLLESFAASIPGCDSGCTAIAVLC